VIGTFRLYRRYPLLFFVLAAGVIVPYKGIVLPALRRSHWLRDAHYGHVFVFIVQVKSVAPGGRKTGTSTAFFRKRG